MDTLLEVLVKELKENGVSARSCEIITDNDGNSVASEPFLDFSEHDKKVAKEKDAEIESLKIELSKANDNFMALRSRVTVDAIEYFVEEKYDSLVITLPKNMTNGKRNAELEDRHQSDCIRINQLLTTIDVLTERYQKLRDYKGL